MITYDMLNSQIELTGRTTIGAYFQHVSSNTAALQADYDPFDRHRWSKRERYQFLGYTWNNSLFNEETPSFQLKYLFNSCGRESWKTVQADVQLRTAV